MAVDEGDTRCLGVYGTYGELIVGVAPGSWGEDGASRGCAVRLSWDGVRGSRVMDVAGNRLSRLPVKLILY